MHHVTAGEQAVNDYYVIKIPPSFFIDLTGHREGIEYVMRLGVNKSQGKCIWKKGELENTSIKNVLDALILEYENK